MVVVVVLVMVVMVVAADVRMTTVQDEASGFGCDGYLF